MTYGEYLVYKLIALAVIVFVVNMVYTAATGRTLEQARRDNQAAKQGHPAPPSKR